MRGGQDAHVDGRLALLADGADALFLDHAQQFDLHVQRQVRDFIEKQRAAFGRGNEAQLVGDRAGEAAALVAEQFAFHELGRNRAAVHRHERALGARPGGVDHACHQFLAGARFTGDVHRRLAARYAQDHFAQAFHRGRVADDLRAGARGHARVRTLRETQRGRHDAPQGAEIQRLGDEIEGAEFERAHRRLDIAVRGDDRAGHARDVERHPLEQVESVSIRKSHVRQAQIELLRLEQFLRAGDITRRLGGELHARERQRDEFDEVRLIIDNQDQRRCHAFTVRRPSVPDRGTLCGTGCHRWCAAHI